MNLDEALTHATLPVQTAGHVFFGLGRNASYEAAKRGDFETMRIGGKIVVPVAPIAAKLGLQMQIGKAAA
jgi:hypothetical protein